MTEQAKQLTSAIDAVLTAFRPVPLTGLGAYLRVEAGLIALVALEDIFIKPDQDPYPVLLSSFDHIARCRRFLQQACVI